jgi:Domain of unknown function (DUF4340)
MNPRQLRILVVVLAGLLVLWGAARVFSHGSDVTTGSLSLPGVTSGNADSITITHAADTIRLTRMGERWSVNGHRASLQGLQDLFLSLRDSSPPDIAALSPTSFGRMGVDSAGGWWMRVSAGGRPVLQLVIGLTGQEANTGYVRRPGSDTVFLWRGRLPQLVRRPLDQWRDHRIAAVSPDSVREIAVDRGGRQYALQAQAGDWHFDGGAAADSGKVAGLLGRFRDLEASGFATPAQADSSRRRRARRVVTLRGPGQAVLAQISFDSTATGYWVHRAGDSTVYRMSTWQVDGITPADSALRPTPAATRKAAPTRR